MSKEVRVKTAFVARGGALNLHALLLDKAWPYPMRLCQLEKIARLRKKVVEGRVPRPGVTSRMHPSKAIRVD